MNDLCLHFSNTVSWRTNPHRRERLDDFADLVAWASARKLISPSTVMELGRRCEEAPEQAQASFERAVAIREVLYRIFSAIAAGDRPHGDDMDLLNDAVAAAYSRLRITVRGDRFYWSANTDTEPFEQITWLVVRSAAELLTSGPLDRVKECAADGCGWLFVDRSRNRSRRWCDMRDCGNRAKARRYIKRKRLSAGQP